MRRASTRAQRHQPRHKCLRSGVIERPRTYTRAALPNAATHIAVCVDHDFLSAARLTRRVPNALRRPVARALPFSRSGGSECNLRPAGSPLPRSSCEPYYSCAATAERGVVDPGGCAIFAGFVYMVLPGASGGLDARCDAQVANGTAPFLCSPALPRAGSTASAWKAAALLRTSRCRSISATQTGLTRNWTERSRCCLVKLRKRKRASGQ